jgi:hypothetical protein
MVHFENDIAVQIEDRCVNAAVVPAYLEQDYTVTTPHDYLSLIAPLTEGEHIVEAVQASGKECELLHIHAHDPCLLIRAVPGQPRILSPTPVFCSRVAATGCRAISLPDDRRVGKSVIADAI